MPGPRSVAAAGGDAGPPREGEREGERRPEVLRGVGGAAGGRWSDRAAGGGRGWVASRRPAATAGWGAAGLGEFPGSPEGGGDVEVPRRGGGGRSLSVPRAERRQGWGRDRGRVWGGPGGSVGGCGPFL